MNNLKIGVIGVGNMGSAHASCILENKIEGLTLTAICDIEESKINLFKDKYTQVEYFDDYKKLIDSGLVEAVIVAVPHRLHSVIAMYALKAGLNVLVEKPEDVSVTQAKKLNDCAKKSGKIFAIMFNQRTNQLFCEAKNILATGKLGKLKRTVWIVTNWYRTQSYYDSGSWRATWAGEGGGVLLNQAPHNLDLWQWICGMPSSVTAFCDVAKYHNIEVEDDCTIVTKYDNGAVGTFITTTGEFPGTNRLEISGTLGKIVIEDAKLKWWKLKQDEEEFRFTSKKSFDKIESEYVEILPTQKETAHAGILQNFANCILKGEKLISPGYDGINELTLSNAAYLSQWKGNMEIKLPFNSTEFDEYLLKKAENSSTHNADAEEVKINNYQTRWQVRW